MFLLSFLLLGQFVLSIHCQHKHTSRPCSVSYSLILLILLKLFINVLYASLLLFRVATSHIVQDRFRIFQNLANLVALFVILLLTAEVMKLHLQTSYTMSKLSISD
jgi:hypothetical protein